LTFLLNSGGSIDDISEVKILIFSFIFLNALALAAGDPCKVDYKNSDCRFRMQVALYSHYEIDHKTVNKEELQYLQTYYKKFGIAGFLHQEPNRSSLFQEAMGASENELFKTKLINDFPKDGTVEGKNIFRLVMPKYVSPDEGKLKNYLFSLNTLFPVADNENLKKTKERFGTPWNDPLFLDGYLDEIRDVIKQIDRRNDLFKASDYLVEKEQLQKIIDRLSPLASVAKNVCTYTKQEEIDLVRNEHQELFQSSDKDVIGCLLKNKQCELVGNLIDSGDYPVDKLGQYFETLIHLESSKACLASLRTVYISMLKNGNPIVSNPKYNGVTFLKEIGPYYQKYPIEENNLCQYDIVPSRNNLDDLSNDFKKVMQHQGFDLMNSILSEKDSAKQDKLIDQFIELEKLEVDLSTNNPKTGKCFLLQIAEAGDHELLGKLVAKGIHPYSLGEMTPDKNDKYPMDYAMANPDANRLKFASILYQSHRRDAGEMVRLKTQLRKVKTKDPEIKKLKDDLKLKVKIDLSHEY
jgi:hypothetical protein